PMDMFNSPSYEPWIKLLYDHISPNFYRAEPRRRAWTYLRNLGEVSAGNRGSRKQATYPGERRADGAQRLLTSAQWNEDQVKSNLIDFIKARFGSSGGTLYVMEMVFPKRGMHAAGVAQQFNVETERKENCQIGVLLFYEASDRSMLFVDRDLYIPECWISDPARCRRASIPVDIVYRSKSEIAVELVNRAFAAGLEAQCVLLSVLCSDKAAAQRILQRDRRQHLMTLTPGEFSALNRAWGHQVRTVSHESYAGGGMARAPVRLRRMTLPTNPMSNFDVSYLVETVADRETSRFPGHYYAYTARETATGTLAELVSKLKGMTIHSRRERDEIGIGRYEVRSWRGWYRHMTLAMVAQTAMALAKADDAASLSGETGTSGTATGPLWSVEPGMGSLYRQDSWAASRCPTIQGTNVCSGVS
ncbi:MAG: IS701 family transposase, partial [Pseudonocardiaceae bacterium]